MKTRLQRLRQIEAIEEQLRMTATPRVFIYLPQEREWLDGRGPPRSALTGDGYELNPGDVILEVEFVEPQREETPA